MLIILNLYAINIVKNINEKNIVFAIGPAGTGKTFLAVAKAVPYLQKGLVNKKESHDLSFLNLDDANPIGIIGI